MKKAIFFFFFLFTAVLAVAQDEQTNLEKYWHYRYRLVNYFMVVGENPGMSLPADIRNTNGSGDIRWGEAPVYLGYYIGVLATEYRLLKDNNQPTDQTLTELYYALHAALRLDIAGETYSGWNNTYSGSINGFLIRDDVPSDFFVNHGFELNQGISNGVTPGSGAPGIVTSTTSDYVTNLASSTPKHLAVSQDVMYELLMGLALVKRFVDDAPLGFQDYVAAAHPNYVEDQTLMKSENFNYDARIEAGHIITYIQNSGSLLFPWTLLDPDGFPVHLGSLGIGYSYATARAGNFITGDDFTDFFEEDAENSWQYLQDPGHLEIYQIGEDANAHPLAMTLAAMSNSWKDHLGPNSNNTTPDQILANGDFDATLTHIASHIGWDVFYGALWDVFHGGPRYISDLCKAKDILNSAPWDGPFCHDQSDKSTGSWCATRRFYDGIIPDDPDHPVNFYQRADVGKPGFYGNYNGLDYMLLFNLYYLDTKIRTSNNNSPFYVPNSSPAVSGSYPYFDGNEIKGFTLRPSIINSLTNPVIVNSLSITSNSNYFPGYDGHLTINSGPQGTLLTNTSVDKGAYLFVTSTIPACWPPDGSWYFNPSMFMRLGPPDSSITVTKSDISLFPNPSSSSFTIAFPPLETEEHSVQIYDAEGKLISEIKNNHDQNINVDVSDLTSGLYIVKVTNGNEVCTKRFVRQ